MVQKRRLVLAGVGAYITSSLIAWLKHGGIQFSANKDVWTLKVYKSLGVIDVFRFDGRLKDMDVFTLDDGLFFFVGMFSAFVAAGLIWIADKIQEPPKEKSPMSINIRRREE